MLKSTHKPSLAQLAETAPLPEGWTEHKAPTGHSYYYHAETKKSTYQRPAAPLPSVAAPIQPQGVPPNLALNPSASFLQYQSIPDAASRNFNSSRGGFNSSRGGRDEHQHQRPRGPQPTDKPKTRYPIPGQDPWILVYTKLGRRFVYNSEKNQSYWRIPDKLKPGILELDQQRIKEKAGIATEQTKIGVTAKPGSVEQQSTAPKVPEPAPQPEGEVGGEESEYEEVEVTDDEEDGAVTNEENPTSRGPVIDENENAAEEPVEFHEDDIAFQLASMGADYGLDPSEYANGEEWAEEGGEMLSAEDATALFCDLLNDYNINPYSSWDKLLSDGLIIDDARYTALATTKKRKEVWESWSKSKIQTLRAQKATEEKKDPKIPWLAFLQKNANPKLYWPEFRRKYKKEAEMKDTSLSDKEREKNYREYVSRLKLPQSQLKADFTTLLREQPLSTLNNKTLTHHLPSSILTDMRYISISPNVREELISGYITTLDGPPSAAAQGEKSEESTASKQRAQREQALREREEKVEEMKRRQRKALEFGKGRLREEEREIERAMDVGKSGLRSHLLLGDDDDDDDNMPDA